MDIKITLNGLILDVQKSTDLKNSKTIEKKWFMEIGIYDVLGPEILGFAYLCYLNYGFGIKISWNGLFLDFQKSTDLESWREMVQKQWLVEIWIYGASGPGIFGLAYLWQINYGFGSKIHWNGVFLDFQKSTGIENWENLVEKQRFSKSGSTTPPDLKF